MLIAPNASTVPCPNAAKTLGVSEKCLGCPVTSEMLVPAVIPGSPKPLPPKYESVFAVALPPTGAEADADTLGPAPLFDVLVAVAAPALAPLTTACADAWPDPAAVALEVALAVPAVLLLGPEPPALPVALLKAVAELPPDAFAVAVDVALPPLPTVPPKKASADGFRMCGRGSHDQVRNQKKRRP